MSDAALLHAYLAVGADDVKRDEAVARLKRRLEGTGLVDFNLDERDMTREQDVDEVISSLNTFPMGAEFRLVIFKDCDRVPEPLRQALIDYLSDPAPQTVALFTATTLAKTTKLYKAIAAQGPRAIIDCAAKKGRDLPVLVRAMAGRYGRTMTLDAAEELISRAGTSTRMLDNELRKLAAMAPGAELGVVDVERFVVRTAEVKPWDFLNAVSAREPVRALELYRLQPPRSEMRLYTLLVGRVRELICAKALDQRGRGGDLARELGLKDWQVRNHRTWARRFSMPELTGALEDAVELECALKGSRDSVTAFTRWFMALATPRRTGGTRRA